MVKYMISTMETRAQTVLTLALAGVGLFAFASLISLFATTFASSPQVTVTVLDSPYSWTAQVTDPAGSASPVVVTTSVEHPAVGSSLQVVKNNGSKYWTNILPPTVEDVLQTCLLLTLAAGALFVLYNYFVGTSLKEALAT